MKRSMRAISTCCLSIARPSDSSRAACSRRHWCHVPAKKRERPASSSSTAVPTASRNQRSCATSTTAASRPTSVCSSHSSDSMSRWLVGSSSSSTSAVAASAREGGARELPAGEGVQGAIEVRRREAEAARHHGRAVAPEVAAERLQPRLRAGVALEQRLVHLALGHAPLQIGELALDIQLLRAAREHVVAQRDAALAWGALVVQRDAHALAEAELAAVDRLLAREHPQQRRLARAVAPRDRHALAALELEGDAAQQRFAGDVLVEVRCDQHSHGRSQW